MAPHLNNALRVRARLAQLEGLSHDLAVALDKADTAIVLFDRSGRCAFINGTAKRILDRRDGLLFADHRIVATDPNESAALLELIRRAVAGSERKEQPGGEAVCITRQEGKSLQVRIAPFPCERLSVGSQFAAIAFIGNPDKGCTLPLEILRAAYGLTPAEAKLAVLLLEGLSITEAAAANRVTRETVRSQLKSIFLKTGTRRQGELIGLLASLPGQIV
jgi:DNA-binding CsgD family transcriptional regulator